MVARKLTTYLSNTNKYGEQVGEWSVDLVNASSKCKICYAVVSNRNSNVCFEKGWQPLIAHSETDKHYKEQEGV